MTDNRIWRKIIPVLASSLVAYFYCANVIPLGYMYGSFPGQENAVLLFASLPGFLAMVGAFASAPLMRVINKKVLAIIGVGTVVIGCGIVRFCGVANLMVDICGMCIAGLAAGILPAVNYATLNEITPEGALRGKVVGYCDAVISAGLMVSTFAAGLFAEGGNWPRAFNLCWVALPFLVITILFYPSLAVNRVSAAAQEQTIESDTTAAPESFPKVLIALFAMKFVSALFYMAASYNSSDYVINETNFGGSSIVGMAATANSFVAIFLSIIVFTWIKKLKAFSAPVALALLGFAIYALTLANSAPLYVVAFVSLSVGMTLHHSSWSSFATMVPTGEKSVGLSTSLFVGATFVGEFLSAYAVPFVANMISSTTSATLNMRVGAIACMVLAVVEIPVCASCYKFFHKNTVEQ